MSTTDEIHIAPPTAASNDFEYEGTAAQWYVLLWSQSQNGFHIERHSHMLSANRSAYAEDRRMDFVPVFVGTQDFCCQMAEKLRGTLRHRGAGRQTTRVIDAARGTGRAGGTAR